MRMKVPHQIPSKRGALCSSALLFATMLLVAACSSSAAPATDGAVDSAGGDIGDGGAGDSTPTGDSARPDGPTADAAPHDGPATDAVGQDLAVSDLGANFGTAIAGTWLLGWSGGMNHYSWVRLSPTSATSGDAQILDGAALAINAPFWPCNGQGSYDLVTQPRSIQLHFPSSLCNGMKSSVLTFSSFNAAGGYPAGAIDSASITISGSSGSPVEAYRFGSSQCDATMTSCTDPL